MCRGEPRLPTDEPLLIYHRVNRLALTYGLTLGSSVGGTLLDDSFFDPRLSTDGPLDPHHHCINSCLIV